MSLKRHKLQRVNTRLKKGDLYLNCYFLQYATSTFPIMYLIPPPPPQPPIQNLHNLCFSFLLGITALPREIENNAMGNVEVG